MSTENEKIQRLISIAKLYYLENMTQSEIAKIVGVSRPLISKFLTEARELGLVKIEINDILKDNVQESRSEELCK
ncbi:sigma factor-like helix-turn-helix DNA-binding protein, partial [Cetobacterium sp.]